MYDMDTCVTQGGRREVRCGDTSLQRQCPNKAAQEAETEKALAVYGPAALTYTETRDTASNEVGGGGLHPWLTSDLHTYAIACTLGLTH